MPSTHFKKYNSAAGGNQIVASGKAVLHRIIIGADVASAVIEVSDHASNGTSNIVLRLAGSTLLTSTKGCVEVGALFENGITVTTTNQTHVTYVWEPVA